MVEQPSSVLSCLCDPFSSLAFINNCWNTLSMNRKFIALLTMGLLLQIPLLKASSSCPASQQTVQAVWCYNMLALPNPQPIGPLVDSQKKPVQVQTYSYVVDKATCSIVWIPEGDTPENAWESLSSQCHPICSQEENCQAYVYPLLASSARLLRQLPRQKAPHNITP